MAMFLLSEAVFFFMLIAAFIYFRDREPAAAAAQPESRREGRVHRLS